MLAPPPSKSPFKNHECTERINRPGFPSDLGIHGRHWIGAIRADRNQRAPSRTVTETRPSPAKSSPTTGDAKKATKGSGKLALIPKAPRITGGLYGVNDKLHMKYEKNNKQGKDNPSDSRD